MVALSLTRAIKAHPAIGWIRVNSVANEEPDFAELPLSVQAPCIQEGARQLFIKTFGRAPSKRELYDTLNKSIVEQHTTTLTQDDYALFLAEQNSPER